MLTTTRSAAANMCGYFSGLSSPSVTEMTTTLRVLADVEERRADQVADVLDEQQRARRAGRASRSARLHHRGVEVAAGAGVDLDGAGAGARDPVGVERGLLVALDHADRAAVAEARRWCAPAARSCPTPGELIRLTAVIRRAGEPGADVLGEVVVLGQQPLLERQRLVLGSMRVRAWSCGCSCVPARYDAARRRYRSRRSGTCGSLPHAARP